MLDLLRSLEWCAIAGPHGEDWNVCPECREAESGGKHAPDCRLDRAIRGLTPAPEPTVDEMARKMGYQRCQDCGRWRGPDITRDCYPDDRIPTLYREHKAKQIDATIAGKRVGPWLTPPAEKVYEASMPVPPDGARYGGFNDVLLQQAEDCYVIPIGKPKPPTDPSALAAWLYARVVPGHTVVEWTEPSVDRIRTRKAFISALEQDVDHIVLWPHGDSALYVPPPANHTHRATKLVNPDGTVLWEAP